MDLSSRVAVVAIGSVKHCEQWCGEVVNEKYCDLNVRYGLHGGERSGCDYEMVSGRSCSAENGWLVLVVSASGRVRHLCAIVTAIGRDEIAEVDCVSRRRICRGDGPRHVWGGCVIWNASASASCSLSSLTRWRCQSQILVQGAVRVQVWAGSADSRAYLR